MSEPIIQGRLLWCDAEANCHRLSDRSGVIGIIEKAKKANINTLIVDVKPLGGEVLYTSKLTPRLGEVEGKAYPPSFDLLQAMIEEGHARGIKVHAAINVFSEGHREWGRGPAYEHPEWQVTLYEAVWEVALSNGSVIPIEIVNPWNPVDEPAIYTRKSGPALKPEAGKSLVVIECDTVVAIIDTPQVETPIPEDGCVISLPSTSDIAPVEKVSWRSHAAFRPAVDSKVPSFGIFVNPIGPAREHELAIIKEIVSGYDIDAIVFDRLRYPNLYADFGEESRAAFEAWLGRGPIKWPEDIFAIADMPWKPPIPGKYYKEWIEWRAQQIRDFAGEAADLVRSIKPEVKVGVYVGSWYESYYDVGVNWASSNYHAGYSWMTPEYNRTGYAELFDYICTGCYYPIATREEARMLGRSEGATVEGACELSCQVISGAASVYGSLYLRDYNSNDAGFRKAIDTVLNHSDGIMLFDLVYLEDYGWWPILHEPFASKAISPHDSNS